MSSYKLYAFPDKNRAEPIIMMFNWSGTPFEDVRLVVTSDEWKAMKPKLPFEQLPVLEVDGHTLCQGTTIQRFLARRFGLYGQDELENTQVDVMVDAVADFMAPLYTTFGQTPERKLEIVKKYQTEQLPKLLANLEKNVNAAGFCVGNSLTLADIALYNALTVAPTMKGLNVDMTILEEFPNLNRLLANVRNDPNLAAYFKQ